MAGINKLDYINKPISNAIEKIILDRKVTLLNKKENATMCEIVKEDNNDYSAQVIVPINASGDVLGAIILFSKEEGVLFKELEVKSLIVMANFLAKQLE